jgi:DNA-nicking Smr family endonuclease
MTRKRRDLTPDEQTLWEIVSKKVKPLSPGKKPVTPPPSKPYRTLRKKAPMVLPPELPHISQSTSSHRIQRIRNVDIEARLDLHGFSREKAREALARFLVSSQERGCHWVLVITGKGRPQLDQDGSSQTRPYKSLRDLVPQWLEEPHFRAVVSVYTTAKPQDGGGGALYVRL